MGVLNACPRPPHGPAGPVGLLFICGCFGVKPLVLWREMVQYFIGWF